MPRITASCNLENCFLCKNSLPGWIPAIGANKKNIPYKKGAVIAREGEPVKGIFFLYDGVVKVHRQWDKNRELILSFAKAGDIVGYRGLGEKRVYPVSITAVQPSIMCFVDSAFFETSLGVNHQVTYQLMKLYANELEEAEKRMRNLALMDVNGRLSETLIFLEKRFGKTKAGFINLLLSRQDLASFIGTTYETLFRTMAELVRRKIIKVNGKKIYLVKAEKLVEFSTVRQAM
jgi:CRP/FNR family transcriptional regulator